MECAICLTGATEESGPVLQTTCDHPFHRSCLVAWSKKSPTCPMCKRDLAKMLTGAANIPRGSILMAADVDPDNPDTWPGACGGIAIFGEEEIPSQVWRVGATTAVLHGPAAGVAVTLAEWRKRVGTSACISNRSEPRLGIAAVAVRNPTGLRVWEPADPEVVVDFLAERVVTGILDTLQKISNGLVRFVATRDNPDGVGISTDELRALGDYSVAAVGGFSALMEWRYRDPGAPYASGPPCLRGEVAWSLARSYADMLLS